MKEILEKSTAGLYLSHFLYDEFGNLTDSLFVLSDLFGEKNP